MKEFLPTGDLEITMMKAKEGFLPFADMLSMFLNTRIVVPSAAEVAADGTGFQPLEFSKEKVQMLGCFTTAERIADFSSVTPFYLEITGAQLLQRLPPDYGVVINPGWPVGFDISPEGIKKILVDFPS
jgi:hypothetical protein